jgi:transposase
VRAGGLGGKRLRGEILLSAAEALAPGHKLPSTADALPATSTSCTLFDVHTLVESDLWDQIPADVPELLDLLPRVDLYVQDEVDVRHHPTLTRVWSRKGRAGQRQVRAPGVSLKAGSFVAIDWRDGWCSWGLAPGRTAQPFVAQLDHLVARSQARGRITIVLLDNAKIHTPQGANVVREAMERHGDTLRLVPTPAYDPQANPTERLFPPFRRAVTHNHHRDKVSDLLSDAFSYFEDLDAHPDRVLRHIASPFALTEACRRLAA